MLTEYNWNFCNPILFVLPNIYPKKQNSTTPGASKLGLILYWNSSNLGSKKFETSFYFKINYAFLNNFLQITSVYKNFQCSKMQCSLTSQLKYQSKSVSNFHIDSRAFLQMIRSQCDIVYRNVHKNCRTHTHNSHMQILKNILDYFLHQFKNLSVI